MIICERLYRAVRERELKGISSVKPDEFSGIFDFKYYLDAMYSHEIPSHTLHKNELYYSWTPNLEIAKQFLIGKKGTGGYVAIAYIDVLFDTEKGLPTNLSKEILFAYPLNRRENWIDMLVIREYYSKTIINGKYLELNNLNYKARKKPYFLSNLLMVRNSAFSLAAKTEEYVLIMKNAKCSVIGDIEEYKVPIRNNNSIYTGITHWLFKKAKADYIMRQSIKSVIVALEKDMDLYKENNVISFMDYKEIKNIVDVYWKAIV